MSDHHDCSTVSETSITSDAEENGHLQLHRLRSFLVGLVPLGTLYAFTALAYKHGQSSVWMWSNLTILGLLIIYLLVFMFHRPTRRNQMSATPKWVDVLGRFVDDDRWFSVLALLLPVIILIITFSLTGCNEVE